MTLKNSLKTLTYRIAPRLAAAIQGRVGFARFTRNYVKQERLQVADGPFAGMRYVSQAVGSAIFPKLAGCYEAELHPIVAQIIATPYTSLIDIGCAEGYYAIGLTLQMPKTHAFAFDIELQARNLCTQMAEMNGVSQRVTVEAECTTERLKTLLIGHVLVISDCEGCEYVLLQSSVLPEIANVDLLIELHPWENPGAAPHFLDQFRETHHITIIPTTERNPSEWKALAQLSKHNQEKAVLEGRPMPMEWAFMVSKQNH